MTRLGQKLPLQNHLNVYSSFKKRVTFVPNVKEAIIERKLFSGVNFIVLLRDKVGKKYAINPNYSEPESTANQLAKRINTSIKSNIDFKSFLFLFPNPLVL